MKDKRRKKNEEQIKNERKVKKMEPTLSAQKQNNLIEATLSFQNIIYKQGGCPQQFFMSN